MKKFVMFTIAVAAAVAVSNKLKAVSDYHNEKELDAISGRGIFDRSGGYSGPVIDRIGDYGTVYDHTSPIGYSVGM